MGKIFKTLKPYWGYVVLIALLLVVQAFCDLALPQYTSDIIDVGITNKGVSHTIPEKITSAEYDYAEMFMDDSERKVWEGAFNNAEEGVYTRQTDDEEKLDELDDRLMVPLLMNYQTSHMAEDQFRKIIKQAAGNAPQMSAYADRIDSMTPEQIGRLFGTDLHSFKEENEDGQKVTYVDTRPILQMMVQAGAGGQVMDQLRSTVEKMVDNMGGSLVTSMGAAYAASCDKGAGMDMDDLQMSYMWSVGLKMGIMALIMLAVAFAVAYIASGVGAAVGRDLRRGIFHNVMSFSSSEMDHFSTASLITRSTNDIQQIQMVIVILLRVLLYAPVLGVGGIVKVAQTGADMGWIIILAVVCIVIFVAILMGATIKKFRMMQKLVDALNLISREILTGLSVIRAFGREKEEEKRFDKANKDLAYTQLFTSRVMTFMMPGMTMIMYGVTLLIVWVSAHRINAGSLQIGTMTAFITYAMMIVMSFLMMTMISIFLPRAGVAAERIDEVIHTNPDIGEPEEPEHIEDRKGLVEFSHVGFSYPGADEEVLSDISFTAEPGEVTAFIGSTGSGKSTLINLIPRFYDVTSGSITVDGVDIRKLPVKELRDMIGFVPQKGVLFSGTIASNLRFGDSGASEEQLKKAADIAQASEFIDEKEEGFDSPVSQGGSNVSGGQKQRLAIARAVVKDPEIFVFDDSFSALDMKTDAKLREALEKNTENSTVLIVAQRISTIMNAQQIIVLDEGKIVGRGSHEELLKSCDVYREIAMSQLSPEELGIGTDGAAADPDAGSGTGQEKADPAEKNGSVENAGKEGEPDGRDE